MLKWTMLFLIFFLIGPPLPAEANGRNIFERIILGDEFLSETEADTETGCTSCFENTHSHPQELQNHRNLQQITEHLKQESIDPWADVPAVSNYSSSTQVEDLIHTAMRRKRSRTARLCYKYVKDALLSSDLVGFRPRGKYARSGVKELKAQGFVNLLDRPEYRRRIHGPGSAPKGAVLVYSKGKKGAGHIEIKTDHGTSGGYVSDYWNEESVLNQELSGMAGGRYRLIGVMIKPMGVEN